MPLLILSGLSFIFVNGLNYATGSLFLFCFVTEIILAK